MAFSDISVLEELVHDKVVLDDYFLIGDEIWITYPSGEFFMLTVTENEGQEEEGEMYFSMVDLLRRSGVKTYQTHEEWFNQQAKP